MRIWHQSFTDLSVFPAYRRRLEAHAAAVGTTETLQVDVHGLAPGTYPSGVAPMIANSYPYIKRIHEEQVAEAVLAADAAGYDAFALGCFFDPGLREARSVASIPVLGLAESCMFVACSLGRRFGLVSLSDFQRDLSIDLADRYGLSTRLAAAVTMTPTVSLFDLESEASTDAILDGFDRACRELTARGAEVIIAGDGVLNEFLVDHGVSESDDAVVVDALGVLFHHTAFFGRLRKAMGLSTSQAGYYASPPSDLLAHSRQFAAQRSHRRFS